MLVVDDDQAVRQMLLEAFDGAGYLVHVARDGREALWKMAEVPRPCALVLDVRMEGMDGPELLTLLQQQGVAGDFPTVLMTGAGAPPDALRALPLVHKPMDVPRLLGLVDALLARPARASD